MKPPSYRRKTVRGIAYAYCTLTDPKTGRRRDFNLGRHGTQESRERYGRLVAEWSVRERLPADVPALPTGPSVRRLAADYLTIVAARFRRIYSIRSALKVLVEVHGSTPAAEFGPKMLAQVRDAMVTGTDKRPAWSRQTTNAAVRMIVAMFRWAVAEERIEPSVWERLRSLESLKHGRTRAREGRVVQPPCPDAIQAARRHVSPMIRAMIDLQLATGMRPGELVTMRAVDIDTAGKVWTYRPASHKTAWRGRQRIIMLGPKARAIVKPLMKNRPRNAPLFSPAEAETDRRAMATAARRTPLSCGNVVGSNRRKDPQRKPGDAYTVGSYRRAIERACDAANREAVKAAGRKVEGRLVERWTPNQLRHAFATEVRRRHGLEAAQILLGHSSALITDAVYAERDLRVAEKIIAKIG